MILILVGQNLEEISMFSAYVKIWTSSCRLSGRVCRLTSGWLSYVLLITYHSLIAFLVSLFL